MTSQIELNGKRVNDLLYGKTEMKIKKNILNFTITGVLVCIVLLLNNDSKKEIREIYRQCRFLLKDVINKDESIIYRRELTNFTLDNGAEFKLINSAIKQNYSIDFKGNILTFDSLYIGKGRNSFSSSYILITQDSIISYAIKTDTTKIAYKHFLKLKNTLDIRIERNINSANLIIINENDTLNFVSDFIGMNNPFIHSTMHF